MAGKNKRNVATFRKSKWYSCMICNCKEESKLQFCEVLRSSCGVIRFREN